MNTHDTDLPVIRAGDDGPAVAFLQRMLNEWIDDAEPATMGGRWLGPLQVTGRHDAATIEAVETFQHRNGLKVDGIPGPGETWPTLTSKYPLGEPRTLEKSVSIDSQGDLLLIPDGDLVTMSWLRGFADACNQEIEDEFAEHYRYGRCEVGTHDDLDPDRHLGRLRFTDTAEVAGAAGAHWVAQLPGDDDFDSDGFVSMTSPLPARTAAHEVFEKLADLMTNKFVLVSTVPEVKFEYIEVCDRVQNDWFDVRGYEISNYITDDGWGNDGDDLHTSIEVLRQRPYFDRMGLLETAKEFNANGVSMTKTPGGYSIVVVLRPDGTPVVQFENYLGAKIDPSELDGPMAMHCSQKCQTILNKFEMTHDV